jgi:bacteriorhodopsin
VLNPLRSEDEAFRFFLYALGIIAAIVVLIVVLRALL